MMRRMRIHTRSGQGVIDVSTIDPAEVLRRLRRRFGRERARYDKWEKEARQERRTQHADRCFYEATQWSVAMGMLDEEIRKIRGRRA